jgi:16S rRNA (cytidine1402-2'-O)-methyltransferase
MAGILYVVATPIGNLEDVTLRALRILREVSLIAAEDTRRTARLLQHYSISTRTTSLHEHNEREKSATLVRRMLDGDSIALVSDAGTPVVSDPGQTLVMRTREAGVRVEAIPGPSAILAAISSSGLPADTFTFYGFPPSRSSDRVRWFNELTHSRGLSVFFEAPHRFRRALEDLEAGFGPAHVIGVARELTKAHEELVVQPISQVSEHFTEARGEFTILVPPKAPVVATAPTLPDPAELELELGHLTANGRLKRREALKELADRYRTTVNVLYRHLSGRHE